MKTIGILTTTLFVIIFGAVFSGFVLTVLWAWFIVPTFHVTQITVPLAIGISLVIGMFTGRSSKSDDKDKDKDKDVGERLWAAFFVALFVPLLTLGIGAIVHAFV